jgi:TANFOR domain-containing protein
MLNFKDMIRKTYKLIPFFVFVSIWINNVAIAQLENPINITINVNPPYSTSLIDYFSSPAQTVVLITNPTFETYTVYLAGSITNLSTQQSAVIPNNEVPGVPPLIITPGLSVLNGGDLKPYVNPASIQYNGIPQEMVLNGNLPEGDYQICLQAYDYNTLQIRSQPEPLGCSNIFTVQFVQPPILISPACSTTVNYNEVLNIVFTWIPPPAMINPALLSYEFKLVEVPQGMNPINAMQATTIPVALENTMFNVFLYSTLNPPLIPGREYAWRVKVSDLSNSILFSNNGESEICTFRYGLPNPLFTPLIANIAYPAPGSRTPFVRVPIIAKYEPVDNNYRNLSTTTNINDNEGLHDLVITQIQWPEGPDKFLQQQIGSSPTLNQLQHIQIGRNLASFPGAAELKHGQNYLIRTDISFEMDGGLEKFATASGFVTRGLYKPIPKQPAMDTVYLNNNRIRFAFRTCDSLPTIPGQMGLVPPSEIVSALRGNQNNLFKAEVRERYRLEIARDISFDTIIVSHSEEFNVDEVITPSTNINFLKSRIYRDINKEIYVPDKGQYYWRVHWLSNPLDSTSTPYETSQVYGFKIMGVPTADTIRAACMADCNATPISNRNPVTTTVPEQILKIGKFDMKVLTINYFGPEASGTGLIQIPFMNTTVKVQFNGVLINAENQVYQGIVAARYDTIGFMPNIPGLGQLTVTNQQELMEYIQRDRYSSVFDPTAPMGLPFGIDKVIDGDRYVIAIVGISFTPERALLAAALSFPMPFLAPRTSDGKTQRLGLGASDICFHPDGLTGLGVGGLYLAEPVEFDYAPGQYIKFKNSIIDPGSGMVADSGTYVSWDCDGFRALHINGEISFSDDLLTKPVVKYKTEAERLKSIKPGQSNYVKARFKFNIRRSGNWLTMLDFDPFCIAGIEDWNFVVKEATLDFSDLENPPNMVFPDNYSGDRSILWNGFHLKQVKLGLPQEIRPRFNNNEELDLSTADSLLADRIIVSVNDLLIDRTGISGKILALNLLDLKDGDLQGWSMSVDSLNLEFVSNSFSRGGFNGKVLTPLTPTQFKYSSVLMQSNDSLVGLRYQFNIMPEDTINVPLWAAKMNILPTSRITIDVDSAGFKPQLVLNGSIDIMQKIGEIDVRFAGVRFETLKLQTVEPILSCSSFTFSSPQKLMAGFPVSVTNIQLGTQEYQGLFNWDDTPGPRQALQFTVNVNFMGEDNSFGGSTTLAILGRFDMGDLLFGGDKYPSLKLTGIDIKTINIKGDLGFVDIKGFINFYAEDPVYGKGFIGGIDATFIKTINVTVVGCFGEINNMRYWYVDAMAKFQSGIPLQIPAAPPIPLPIALYGFGGGAFYKMALTAGEPSKDTPLSNKTPDGTPTPGTTLSPLRLVPDPNVFFGLKATVVLGNVAGGQAFNCDLTIAADINTSGGINSIGLAGSGYFMSSVFDRDFTAVSADVAMVMNFPTKTFNANYNLKVNVPGVMEGARNAAEKIAGAGFLTFSPTELKIISGTPLERNSLKVASALDLQNYLMIGKDLPPPGVPPSEVTSQLNYVINRAQSVIESGTGFAFGASVTPPKIDESFGPFKAVFNWGMGFDLNLMNYGSARCDGMPPGTQMGVNGWYARGSIWAHFNGSIALKTDVFGNINIMSGQAAALLEGGFPNPAWAFAKLNFQYEVLNGLYKGNCQFDAKYGSSCRMAVETPIAGLQMIASLKPENNLQNVDCRTLPSAVFNVDIDREIVFPTMNASGDTVNRRFRFLIDEFVLEQGSNTLRPPVSKKQDGSQALLMPSSMLLPNTNYTVRIRLKAEELVSGQWRIARRNNNSEIIETVSCNFRTGALPNAITDQDVKFSYPFNRQRYFCKNQCSNGSINMQQDGWAHLFTGNPPSGFNRVYIAQFEPNGGGQKLETTASYASGRITFNLPDNLQNSTLYRIRILRRDNRISVVAAADFAGTQFQNVNQSMVSLYGNQVAQRVRAAEDFNALGSNEHLIYQYFFRTSAHNTLNQKITNIQVSSATREFMDPHESLILKMNGTEPLEEYEVSGYRYTVGFDTRYERILEITDNYNTTWHTGFLQPTIYNLYSRIVNNNYSNFRFIRSTPDLVGIPPNRIVASTTTAKPIADGEIDPSLRTNQIAWLNTDLVSAGNVVVNQNIANIVGPIINIAGATPTPNITMVHETSYHARLDYNRLKTIVARMRTARGQNLTGVDNTTKSMINTLDNSTYQYMTGAGYQVRFNALNPTGCSGTAGSTINTLRTFNYNIAVIAPMIMVFTTF